MGTMLLCSGQKNSVWETLNEYLFQLLSEKHDKIDTMLLSCGGKNVNSQPENVQLLDVGGEEAINLMILWLIMSTLMMIRLLGNVNTRL